MSSQKKVPDMFFRALKRKSDVLQVSTKDNVISSNMPNTKKFAPEVMAVIPSTSDPFRLADLLIPESWRNLLLEEFNKKYMKDIESFLQKEYEKKKTIFPPRNEIFSAFNLSPLNDIKVVILGQDPYHDDGQAHGLCFSVKKGVKIPPSLRNIYKELSTDIKSFKIPDHGNLEGWARQGVFMLNAALTVEAHKANSHSKIGWHDFLTAVVKIISRETTGVVFLLWGNEAQKKAAFIDANKHKIIKTAHPSPLSARHWFGSASFSQTNAYLTEIGKTPIDWNSL